MNDVNSQNANQRDWLEIVRRQVESLRFGVVQITVHEANVVQIERTEKVRLGAKSLPNLVSADRNSGSATNQPG